jgi:hypothetical protein
MQKTKLINFSNVIIKNGFWHDLHSINAGNAVCVNERHILEFGSFNAFCVDLKFGMRNQPQIFRKLGISSKIKAASTLGEKKEPVQEKVVNMGGDNPGLYDATR